MSKLNVAVIYGGTNTEHEVSIVSANSVIENLDNSKFNPIPIYISKHNQWLRLPTDQAKKLPSFTTGDFINPSELPQHQIDVVFPVLHGPYGEDGTIQGLIELTHLPYVGCDVLASALCMDKVVQKQLCQSINLPITPFVSTHIKDWQDHPQTFLNQLRHLNFPLFAKPAKQGSSVGIVKIHEESELVASINFCFQYDTKVIVEQAVTNAHEFECAILGNESPQSSLVGEIISSNEFYDYDAKYVDGKSQAIIPAKITDALSQEIQSLSLAAYKILTCTGLARVDFLYDNLNGKIYLNELNTMPGFTSISMYPKLWQASGLNYSDLLTKLINLAVEKNQEKSHVKLSYIPKTNWIS